MSLSAYYQSLSHFKDVSPWLILSILGLSLIAIHGNSSGWKITSFENSLPISKLSRMTLNLLDSVWIQLPLLIFVGIAAITDRFDFKNSDSWQTRFEILIAVVGTVVFNFGLSPRLKQVGKRTFVPLFYFNEATMKARALIKNYFSYSSSSVIWISVFSAIGSCIAGLPNSEQPKLFLYSLFFGLQILPLSKAPALLSEWDNELRPFLNTLPNISSRSNTLVFLVPSAVLLFEAAIWVAISYHQILVFISFLSVSVISVGLFFLLQMRFAKWALIAGILITLTGASVLQASVK